MLVFVYELLWGTDVFLGWFDEAAISPVEPGKLVVQVAGEEDVEEKGGRGGSLEGGIFWGDLW